MFPEGAAKTTTPWPRAGRYKDVQDYDQARVNEVLTRPPRLQDVDPRSLHSTQPYVTRSGVDYYSSPAYHRTGQTYEQTRGGGANVGNAFPVVYRREAHPRAVSQEAQNVLLSGHHRAAAALAEGRPLRAQIVEGPWGPPRKR
jgi:hypothetical protein